MEIRVPYGQGWVRIDCPEENLAGIVHPLEVPQQDEHEVLDQALAHPFATKSLKEFLAEASVIIHGSTLGTNTIITRSGPKMGLITTQGYRDSIELRQIPKEDMYNWRMPCPEPLVPRYLRVEAEERLNYRGEVKTPLNEDSVRKAVSYL